MTGGCCHDYDAQKKILSEGISARAPVEWTIVQQGGSTTNTKIPLYENPDWAKGFDIVVHNECFADIPDPEWTQRVLKPHREGLPAVVIHCAMHCYRDKTDEWFKFLGVTSRGHGGNYPFEVINLDKDNPIMKGFGEKWQTPAGELYLIEKMWPDAKPLGHAMSTDSKKFETCIWTNLYNGKTRVFGTTIGHHNSEMSDPVFLNYVTRGLLWAVDKLDDCALQAGRSQGPVQRRSARQAAHARTRADRPGTGQGGHGVDRAGRRPQGGAGRRRRPPDALVPVGSGLRRSG